MHPSIKRPIPTKAGLRRVVLDELDGWQCLCMDSEEDRDTMAEVITDFVEDRIIQERLRVDHFMLESVEHAEKLYERGELKPDVALAIIKTARFNLL